MGCLCGRAVGELGAYEAQAQDQVWGQERLLQGMTFKQRRTGTEETDSAQPGWPTTSGLGGDRDGPVR